MSELDQSQEFATREKVISSFAAYRVKLREEWEAGQRRVAVQGELAELLSAAEGQHFVISAISGSRGFRHDNGDWSFVATRGIQEKPEPFEPMEMVIGKVGDLFPVHGASVELFYPGVDTSKLIISLDSIVSLQPVTEPAPL